METILITGGTGLIGKALQKKLHSKKYEVIILSRNKKNNSNTYLWDIDNGTIENKAIKKANYIIHLAGAGIADKRWTRKRKSELINSRVQSTKLLLQKVKELNPNLKGFIAASGIGYYGAITTDKIFSEDDTSGSDFLATICKLWEQESLKFQEENIRTVIFRTSVVFSKNGGALEKIVNPIKNNIGAVLGKGNQYMPWIHIDDLCKMYISAIENNNLQGVYNAAAPEHITNKELTQKIAQKLNKKIWLPPIPEFMLKLLFGKMSIMLLKGSRVSCEKMEKSGFKYQFSTIKESLNNILNV
jgi:uncharacterized protein (TIGR01777 family)